MPSNHLSDRTMWPLRTFPERAFRDILATVTVELAITSMENSQRRLCCGRRCVEAL
jgi:hypothetical protein